VRSIAPFLALFVGTLACATITNPTATTRGSRLIAPMHGYYAIYRAGERVGTERFSITSSAGLWRVTGEVEIDEPVEIVHGYELIVDPASEEPLGFDVWVELAGERERAIGVVEGRHVRVDVESIMGPGSGRVPYARGTVIDFASPLANTLALGLLLPDLAVGKSVHVRTISIALPLLQPAVTLQRYTLVGREDDVSRVTIDQEDRHTAPTALWVRADGLPVRVRTWPETGGEPYEMWMHVGDQPLSE